MLEKMNNWLPTDFHTFLKNGWYLFWLVMTAMAVVYVWRMRDKSVRYKVIWTLIILAIPFLGIGIWLFIGYRS
jgi:uncharacterized membrane protein YiaA